MFKAIVSAAFVLFGAQGVLAQNSPQDIQVAINAGNYKAAADMLLANNPGKADVDFFNARVLKAQGKYDASIALLRKLLRAFPDAANVRFELAQTLLLNRQYAASEFQFRELSQRDNNAQATKIFDGFLAKIAREKPMGVSGSFAVVPSSNINRGTYNDTLSFCNCGEIDEDSRAKTGTGLELGLSGYFRKHITPRTQIRADWQLASTQFSGREYDTYRTFGGVRVITSGPKYQLSFGPYLRRSWRHPSDRGIIGNLSLDSKNLGWQAGYVRVLNPKNRLFLNAQIEDQNRPNDPHLDGEFKWGQIGWRHQLAPRLSISVHASKSAVDKNDPVYQVHGYNGDEVRFSAEHIWESGLITSFGLHKGKRGYKADYFRLGRPRHDTYEGVTIGLAHTKIQFKGASPKLSCKAERGRSNVEFFDYNLKECSLGLFTSF